MPTLWVWVYWRTYGGNKASVFIYLIDFYLFIYSLNSWVLVFLCVCCFFLAAQKMGLHPHPLPMIRTAPALRSVHHSKAITRRTSRCTLVWPFLLIIEHGSSSFVHISLGIRPIRPGDFRRKLWPSIEIIYRGQPGGREQTRKGNGFAPAIQCQAATGSTCSSQTGVAARRSAHIGGVRLLLEQHLL